MCIFESATVKSDCPLQENYEIFFNTDCWFTLLVLLFVLEILKKEIKSSENDQLTGHFNQLTGHFQTFFILFSSPTLKLKKNPVNQLVKNFWC